MTDNEPSAYEIMEAYWRASPFWDDIRHQREMSAMFPSGPSWRDMANDA